MKFFRLLILCSSLYVGGFPLKAQQNTTQESEKKNTHHEVTFEDIQQAMIQAESLNAREFAPQDMQQADENLAQARISTNKKERQQALQSALNHLQNAYEASKKPYAQRYIDRLNDIYQNILQKDWQKFAKDTFSKIEAQLQTTQKALQEQGINEKTRFMFDRTWQNIKNFGETAAANLELVQGLGKMVKDKYIEIGAQVPEVEAQLAKGDEAQNAGDLPSALTSYKNAMAALNKSQVTEEFLAKLAETDRLLHALQNDLQKANKLFIVHKDGSLGKLKPFDAYQFLRENPLVENPSIPALYQDQYYSEIELENYQVMEIGHRTPEKIQVAAEISDESLYDQAVSLWEQGVALRNAGYLDDAKKYFQRSRDYLIAFKKGAITKIYTVQNRPQAEDTLWRIAGFKDVYNNPYLWPLLWQRNKEQLNNPDLLHPGQKLLVPPVD